MAGAWLGPRLVCGRWAKRSSRQGWRRGVVAVACRCRQLERVAGTGCGAGFPTGGFFGVVAGFADAGGVGAGCFSAGVPGNDVVQVADGRVAVRSSAGVVSGLDEAAVPGREEPGPGVHPHELAGAGVGVEPPEPEGERGVIAAPGGAARSRATTGPAVTVSVRDRCHGARPRGKPLCPRELPPPPLCGPFVPLMRVRAQPAGTVP